jgi:predicted dehydrogenase
MKKLSRRSFIQHLGIGMGATTALSASNLMDMPKPQGSIYTGKKLNIALCGLGRYADYVAFGLETAQYCHLAGIVTGTPAKAADWQKRYNIPSKNIYTYENFDTIINNKDIDLVYVILPNSMHKEYVIRAAKAGKHVIVEKPMAITAKDCQEMIESCKKAGVQLAVGYRLHYEPYHLELKRLGQERILGQVRLIEASLGYRSVGGEVTWREKKALAGGGPLMNIGIYCVQCSRYVLGEEPMSVTAQFGKVTNPVMFSEVEESIMWQLNFPSGAVCTSTTTYNCLIDRFYAGTDDGYFELSPGLSYGPFKGRTSKGELNFPVINQQTTQCDAIAKEILDNKPLPNHITGEEGLKDMRIIEAIYEAARMGTKVVIS